MNHESLIRAAFAAQKNAYAPVSGFFVGAALLTMGGKTYTGCNVENAALSPAVCAERTAFVKAVSEGERAFAAIAVVGGKMDEPPDYCPPCGVCRQVMLEFCGPDFTIITAKSHLDYQIYTLRELMPRPFDPANTQE